MAAKVSIIEVGPRDGLQNEVTVLDISTRLTFARKLSEAGLKKIELGSFVSPAWVPQMAGSRVLLGKALKMQAQKKINRKTVFSALVPNMRGMSDALDVGVREVAVFAAVSESFSKKNINCSISESFKRFESVFAIAKKNKIKVRGYLSTCFGCPYEGRVSSSKVVKIARRMIDAGAYEVSIGDTIGSADPKSVKSLLKKLVVEVGANNIAMHFHDTRGMAIANISASLEMGVRSFDSSLGGLGGCPYAPGASGNVATEDVVYLLHSMGYDTGVDFNKLISVNKWMRKKIQHSLFSKAALAGVKKVW